MVCVRNFIIQHLQIIFMQHRTFIVAHHDVLLWMCHKILKWGTWKIGRSENCSCGLKNDFYDFFNLFSEMSLVTCSHRQVNVIHTIIYQLLDYPTLNWVHLQGWGDRELLKRFEDVMPELEVWILFILNFWSIIC